MEGKSYIWITKELLCTVLWAASGVSLKASVLEMPPDVMSMSDESDFQGMELTIAPEKSSFDAVETRVENSSFERGSLGMTRAKLCVVLSRYGSLMDSKWQSKQALEELSYINNFLNLVPVPEEHSRKIRDKPQQFLDEIASKFGIEVYYLKVTNGSKISASMCTNFFETFRRPKKEPIHAGGWGTSDSKVMKVMNYFVAGKELMCREEVNAFFENGKLRKSSRILVFLDDRATDKIYVLVNEPVYGKYENVFTKNKFGAWKQQSARWRHRGKGIKQATEAIVSTTADVGAGTVKLGATGARLGATYAPEAFNLVKSVAENTPKYKEKIDTAVEYVNKAANAVNSVANGTSGTAKFFSWMPFSKSITETLGSASSVLKPIGENIEQFGGKLASASEKLTWVNEKVAPVIDKVAPTLGPVLTILKIARLVGLGEYVRKVPKVFYPSGDSELEKLLIIHAKAAIALSGVKAKELSRDSNQMRRAAWMSDRVHLYDAAITLTEDWKQGLAQYPQEAATQLAIGTARNVCCLVVTSGRFMCPNFFQKLYSFQYDPDYGRVIPEVTRVSGIYDRKVCSILGEKCPIDALLNTDTLLYIIDDASKEVYQVVYNNDFALPPQFPNIFNAQSWENWEGAIAPTTGWRFRKAMRLLGATSKNAFRKNVPIVGKMLISQETKGTPELTIPVAVGQLGMGDPLAKTVVEMPVSNAAIQQAHNASGPLGYEEPVAEMPMDYGHQRMPLATQSFKEHAMQRDRRKQQSQSVLSNDDRYDTVPMDYSDPEFMEEAPSGMSHDGAMELEVPAIRTSVPVQQVRRDQIVPTKNTPRKVGIRKTFNRPRPSGYRPIMMRSKGYGNEGIFLGASKFRQGYQPQSEFTKNDPYTSKFAAEPMNESDDEPRSDEMPEVYANGGVALNVNAY